LTRFASNDGRSSTRFQATAITLGLLLAVFLTGCATVITGSKRTIVVESSPPGAEVYINDDLRGVTPFKHKMEVQKEPMTLKVKLEGYKPEVATFERKWEAQWLLLDLLGGIILFPVDMKTGAWYGYAPSKFDFQLQPADTTQQQN